VRDGLYDKIAVCFEAHDRRHVPQGELPEGISVKKLREHGVTFRPAPVYF
jgi:hypothetical protein